jgi:hypothetical protein
LMNKSGTLPYGCHPQNGSCSKGRERAPAENNREEKPEQLKLGKTYPSTWP